MVAITLIIAMFVFIYINSLDNPDNWKYDKELTNQWLKDTSNENNLGYEWQIRVFKYDDYPKRVRLYGRVVYPEAEWELLDNGVLKEDGSIEWK